MQESNLKTMQLKNGRRLGYAEYGVMHGTPMLYCHGFPSSHLEASQFHTIAATREFRLIAIDRPGMGLSCFNKEGSLSSWVEDVRELLDTLSIDKTHIISYSGGAPFLIACAASIPERILSCAIVSGLAPLDILKREGNISKQEKIIGRLLGLFPFLSKFMMKATFKLLNDPKKMLAQIEKKLPEVDKKVLREDSKRKHIIANTLKAFQSGIEGPAHEMLLLFKSWNIDFARIQCPVRIWHGLLDVQAEPVHAETYKKLLPNSQLNLLDNEGHHSLISHHFYKILDDLKDVVV